MGVEPKREVWGIELVKSGIMMVITAISLDEATSYQETTEEEK